MSALDLQDNTYTIHDIVRKLSFSSAAQVADVMATQNHEDKPAAQTQ